MEKKIAVQQFKISYICDSCKKGEMLPSGAIVPDSHPQQYYHVCEHCGEEQIFECMYPYSVMEEINGEETGFLDGYGKRKKYTGIKVLKDDKLWADFLEEIMERDEFKHVPKEDIEKKRIVIIDWLESKKKRYQNYKSFFKNILRRDFPPKTGQKMVM